MGNHLGIGNPVGIVIPLEWGPPEGGIGEILEWRALGNGDLPWEWGALQNRDPLGKGEL